MFEPPAPKECRHCEEDAVRRGNLLRASGCGHKRLLRFARNDETSIVVSFVTHHTRHLSRRPRRCRPKTKAPRRTREPRWGTSREAPTTCAAAITGNNTCSSARGSSRPHADTRWEAVLSSHAWNGPCTAQTTYPRLAPSSRPAGWTTTGRSGQPRNRLPPPIADAGP